MNGPGREGTENSTAAVPHGCGPDAGVASQGRKLRIAFVINSLHTGGAEIVLLNLLREVRTEVDARVYSLTRGGALRPKLEDLGIGVSETPIRPAWRAPLSLRSLKRDLEEFAPDIVHTWMYHSDLLGGLAARMARVPRVAWGIHHSTMGPGIPLSTRVVAWMLERLSLRLPDGIQCCSEAAAELHIEAGYPRTKMTVIPNGVDPCQFRPREESRHALLAELGLPSNVLLVGTVGRFHPQKDYATFFEAAGLVASELTEVEFVLVGWGLSRENAAVRQWAASAGIAERTHLLGPRRDVPEIMSAFDVYGSSSAFGEAFPVVLLEAMACGTPCVATDVGDSRIIVGDSGIIVPPSDPRSLGEGWLKLLRVPAPERVAMGIRARERIVENYAWPRIARRFLEYYRALNDG